MMQVIELKKSQTCSKGLLVLIPFPPQKTQLSLKPRLVMDVLPSSAISFRASSLSLGKKKKYTFSELSLFKAPFYFNPIKYNLSQSILGKMHLSKPDKG